MDEFENKIQAKLPDGIRFFSVLESKPYGKRYFLSLEISHRKAFWEDELLQIHDIESFIAQHAKAIAMSVKERAVEIFKETTNI